MSHIIEIVTHSNASGSVKKETITVRSKIEPNMLYAQVTCVMGMNMVRYFDDNYEFKVKDFKTSDDAIEFAKSHVEKIQQEYINKKCNI